MTDLEYSRNYERLRTMRRQRTTAEINGDFRRAEQLKRDIDVLSLAMADSIAAEHIQPRDSAGRFTARNARP